MKRFPLRSNGPRFPLRDSPKTRKREEAELQATCSQLLELDGWRYLRTDPVSDRASLGDIRRRLAAKGLLTDAVAECLRSRGKGFGEVGMADGQYRRYAENPNLRASLFPNMTEHERRAEVEMLWIEWKSITGRPSVEQTLWIKAEQNAGALVWLAGVQFRATFEDFKAFYRTSGLCKNESLFR